MSPSNEMAIQTYFEDDNVGEKNLEVPSKPPSNDPSIDKILSKLIKDK